MVYILHFNCICSAGQKEDIDEELISVETDENYDELDRSQKGATKTKHSRGLTAVDNVVTEQQPNITEEKQLHTYASNADEGAATSGKCTFCFFLCFL